MFNENILSLLSQTFNPASYIILDTRYDFQCSIKPSMYLPSKICRSMYMNNYLINLVSVVFYLPCFYWLVSVLTKSQMFSACSLT